MDGRFGGLLVGCRVMADRETIADQPAGGFSTGRDNDGVWRVVMGYAAHRYLIAAGGEAVRLADECYFNREEAVVAADRITALVYGGMRNDIAAGSGLAYYLAQAIGLHSGLVVWLAADADYWAMRRAVLAAAAECDRGDRHYVKARRIDRSHRTAGVEPLGWPLGWRLQMWCYDADNIPRNEVDLIGLPFTGGRLRLAVVDHGRWCDRCGAEVWTLGRCDRCGRASAAVSDDREAGGP